MSLDENRSIERRFVLFHIADGKIAEVWNFWDTMNVLRQLGQTPG